MTDEATLGAHRNELHYHFDRHTPEYRERFQAITQDMQSKCPLAWTDTYGGHWVAASNKAVFDLARDPRYGRVEEMYSEDPYLAGTLGVGVAHVVEQHDHNRLIRPRSLYTGPELRPYPGTSAGKL